MCFAQGWRYSQSFLRQGARFRLTRPIIDGKPAIENGSLRVSQGKPRIKRDGLQVDFLRLEIILRPTRRNVKHVGLRVSSGSGIKTRLFFRRELRFQSGRDPLGDITLDCEDI